MINLVEQFVTMKCVEHINQKKMKLNDIYRNHTSNMKIITQQNDQNQSLKSKNQLFQRKKRSKKSILTKHKQKTTVIVSEQF